MLQPQLLTPALLEPPGFRPKGPSIIRLGRPGKCGAEPTFTVSITDESGSTTNLGGADPLGRRHLELGRAFARMAGACRGSCGNCAVAALTFDSPQGDLAPAALRDRKYRSRIGQHFGSTPRTDGSSYLAPALARAAELAANRNGGLRQLVVMTDWELFDREMDVLEALSSFDHVLAIGLNRPVPEWAHAPHVTPFTLGAGEPTGALAAAMFSELIRGRVGATERSAR